MNLSEVDQSVLETLHEDSTLLNGQKMAPATEAITSASASSTHQQATEAGPYHSPPCNNNRRHRHPWQRFTSQRAMLVSGKAMLIYCSILHGEILQSTTIHHLILNSSKMWGKANPITSHLVSFIEEVVRFSF